jgi:Tol biopolymer transport system component
VHPTWSPNGSRIAFASTRADPDPGGCGANCNHEIYVIKTDGSGLARLTNHPAHDWDPDWIPE